MEQKRKPPRPFTEEEKQTLFKHITEHRMKLEADPEYKAWWDKQVTDLQHLFPFDSVEE